jgi:hypothetical protein
MNEVGLYRHGGAGDAKVSLTTHSQLRFSSKICAEFRQRVNRKIKKVYCDSQRAVSGFTNQKSSSNTKNEGLRPSTSKLEKKKGRPTRPRLQQQSPCVLAANAELVLPG